MYWLCIISFCPDLHFLCQTVFVDPGFIIICYDCCTCDWLYVAHCLTLRTKIADIYGVPCEPKFPLSAQRFAYSFSMPYQKYRMLREYLDSVGLAAFSRSVPLDVAQATFWIWTPLFAPIFPDCVLTDYTSRIATACNWHIKNDTRHGVITFASHTDNDLPRVAIWTSA